jgi:TPP-dependent indolepyruvate ferredoxin oxidoreductase alpha subunit
MKCICIALSVLYIMTKGRLHILSKKIMLGNEAIARGAYEAGVKVTSAYPGTPSTEISENVVWFGGFVYHL